MAKYIAFVHYDPSYEFTLNDIEFSVKGRVDYSMDVAGSIDVDFDQLNIEYVDKTLKHWRDVENIWGEFRFGSMKFISTELREYFLQGQFIEKLVWDKDIEDNDKD